MQLDGTSCGIFVAMTVYYLLVQQQWPTRQDFTQGNIPTLRLFMLKVILDTNSMFATGTNENWFDDDAGIMYQGRRQLRRSS
jgi:Ulp1 family protease